MELNRLLWGNTDPRSVLRMPGQADGTKGSVLATFRGFTPSGRGRDSGLDLMERLRLISAEQRAEAGPTPARGARMAAPVAVAVAAPIADAVTPVASDNAIYRGTFAQMLARDGYQLPFVSSVDAPANAAPVDGVPTADPTPLDPMPAPSAPEAPRATRFAHAPTSAPAPAIPVVDDLLDGVATLRPAPAAALVDDTFRTGLPGVMSMSAGIDDTLRLLAKF